MAEFNFEGKFIITGKLIAETGLRIGGATESIEIGGVDNIVVKDPLTGFPYIPGSSLKGKMRSLLEWVVECENNLTCVQRQLQDKKEQEKKRLIEKENKEKEEAKRLAEEKVYSITACDCGKCDVCIIFGTSAAEAAGYGPTRLTVRDSMPTQETRKKWTDELGENIFTEIKWENVIDRITSAATPRQIERIPADSIFHVEMVYDVYQKSDYNKLERVFQAMKLLEDSYLGGSGTRGYGKVSFQGISVKFHPASDYIKVDELNKRAPLVENKSVVEVWSELNKNEEFKKLTGGK